MHGCVLHDSHAEVLARRGLVRVLWLELISCKNPYKDPTLKHRLLEASTNAEGKYQLRSDIQLHLYISCSPCGDAAIYPLTNDQVMLHTGAKLIVSGESTKDAALCGGGDCLLEGTNVARESVQSLGKLRTKSGRSNLPANLRSTSMSCSDKIVKWSVLGLQGGLLSALIDPPIFFSNLVVSKDVRAPEKPVAQQAALQRAVTDRVKRVSDSITTDVVSLWKSWAPSVHIVNASFPSDKSVMEFRMPETAPRENDEIKSGSSTAASISADGSASGRKRKRHETSTKLSACGISLNWHCLDPDGVELIVGARGTRQGKKPKSNQDYFRLASRLCRREFLYLAQKYYEQSPGNTNASESNATTPKTYQEVKRTISGPYWCECKDKILTNGILSGWLRSGEEGDFQVGNYE